MCRAAARWPPGGAGGRAGRFEKAARPKVATVSERSQPGPSIAFGADELTATARGVLDYLVSVGDVEVVDCARPWPLMARAVAESVAGGRCRFGVVMCWSGTGSAIAANKVPGIRAAQAWEAWVAVGARRWNDANVLALSSMRLSPMVAVECARAFLETRTVDPDEEENIGLLLAMDADLAASSRQQPPT